MRLFIAIPLSKYLRKELEGYVKQYAGVQDVRWTAVQNLHITVQFLGEVDEQDIPSLVEKLDSLAQKIESFQITFQDISFAPPNKEPRMIWANFTEKGQYSKLVYAVSEAADEFIPHNLHDEQVMRKARHPHITLARFKDPNTARSLEIIPLIVKKDTINVGSFELWESTLTPNGPQYRVARKYRFLESET